MRILYVEDDLRDADLTKRSLAKAAPHLQLETVSSISEALDRLTRLDTAPLDLVLTDVHLRDGDGLSLLAHIRQNALPLAVVIVTGLGDEDTAVTALKARADDYVVKRTGYLDRLPLLLESAFNHHNADAARRSHPLRVLFASNDFVQIEAMRKHFAVQAEHIFIDVVNTGDIALATLRTDSIRYDVLLLVSES